MKILSYQIFHTEGSHYLEFELNNGEHIFLTTSRVIKLVKRIAPWVDLTCCAPLILLCHVDKHGNCKIQINVDPPFNEKIIRDILRDYINANVLLYEEANNLFNLVCHILKIKFKPFDRNIMLKNQLNNSSKTSANLLLQGIITTPFQDKIIKATQQKEMDSCLDPYKPNIK